MAFGSSARKKRQQKMVFWGVILIVLSSVIIGTFVYFRIQIAGEHIELDAVTLCPVDGPSAYTAILIDGTDNFTPIQHADLTRYFQAMVGDVATYEQVSLFAPRALDSESLLKPELVICNPGSGADKTGVTDNPRQIRRKYQTKFVNHLEESLKEVLVANEADQSPIMGMIQAVAISTFPVGDDSTPKRLIIVSDMLENTGAYSQYKDHIDFESVKDSPWFQHLTTRLNGVKVEVLYIGRQGAERLQTRRHAVFWEQYFYFLGAQLDSITRIGG